MEEMHDNPKKTYSRTTQHTLIMQSIYQYLFYLTMDSRPSPKEIIENITMQPLEYCDKFITSTFVLAIKHCQEAVDKVSSHLVDWEFSRLSLVDQAILILGYIELKYIKTPAPVIINICVHLSQRYSSYDAHRYINGVLDKVKDEL